MEDKLLELLKWDKPTTRLALSIQLKISERKVEELVAKLRDRGESVCSNSDTAGYWLSEGEDLTRTIKELERRGLVLLERARKMKDRQLRGQVSIDEALQ